jgi:NADPH2:quinone reductase
MDAASQAEYAAVGWDKCTKVPSGIEPGIAAASLVQGLTALALIRESHEVKPGDSVLVHAAAGGVGLWLCQVLRAAGAAKIIATASTEEKLELARKNGATHGINYSKEDWVKRVKEITEDNGVIAVFDGVGKSTFDGDLEVLSRKGSLVTYGDSSGPVPPLELTRLAPKNIKVVKPRLFAYVATKEELDLYAGELLDLIKQKKVEVKIHKVYRLDEAQQAHEVSFSTSFEYYTLIAFAGY